MATFTQMKDEMKVCPYNPTHKVSARRLQSHIIKCSRNPGNPVLVDCPFNALHKVSPEELSQHILLCKDSRQVIREMEESRHRSLNTKPLIPRSDLPVSSTEDWDEEEKEPTTYTVPGLVRFDQENNDKKSDEEEDKKDKPFAIKTPIQIQCMKPSDRKKYYKELAEKAKAKELPVLKSELRMREENSWATTTVIAVEDDDNPSNIRKPMTFPFKNKMMGGIGRGSTPLANRSPTVRSIGSESSLGVSSGVKRERNGNDSNRSKRFSPDLQ